MDTNWTRKKVATSDWSAFRLFKEDPENEPVTLDEKEISEKEMFPSLNYLSDEFRSDLDRYIQYKIDAALLALK